MAEKFAPYDTADYLKTTEDMAYYLEAVLEEAGDDAAFISKALGTIARSQNFSELARKVGVSREGLYKALSEDGNPSFATIMKVAKALGSAWSSTPSRDGHTGQGSLPGGEIELSREERC